MKRLLPVLIFLSCATPKGGKEKASITEMEFKDKVVAIYVDEIPLKDPNANEWNLAPKTIINLLPQNIIVPKKTVGEPKPLEVRAIYTDKEVAFLLTWEDKTEDIFDFSNRFTDKVAIQIPLNPNDLPSYMMGNIGGRVYIVEWKALWQWDVEKGYADINDIYPNYWVDFYWFVNDGKDTIRTEPPKISEFKDRRAFSFIPAYSAGNPDMVINKKWPVMEFSAEGFGTLTPHKHQDARGWGVYDNGKWKVIISIPRVPSDENNAQIYKGTSVAFAVWNGSEGDRGSRKSYSMWIPLELK